MIELEQKRIDALHRVVQGLGELISSYEEKSPAAAELEQARKYVLGIVFGEKTGVLTSTPELTSAYNSAMSVFSEDRIMRALTQMNTAEKAAGVIADLKLFQEMLKARK